MENNLSFGWGTTAGASYTDSLTLEYGGNVGIGTDDPNKKLHIVDTNAGAVTYQRLENGGTTAGTGVGLLFTTKTSNGGNATSVIRSVSENTTGNSSLIFTTPISGSTAERMRITSGGQVLINQTTSNSLGNGFGVHPIGSGGGNLVACHNGTAGTALIVGHGAFNGTIVDFRRASVQVGTISVTSSATAYNTSGSDKRLKKNITDWDENILDKFKDIQPKEFHFNEQEDTEEKQKGYIAQNEVDKFPEAYPLVYNEELKEDRHMYNPSGMTVYLMKAIQELKAEVDKLKTQINN